METAFFIILIHFVSDFICQDEKWALGKSKNLYDLLCHTYTYSSIWLIPIIFLFPKNWTAENYFSGSILFAFITLVSHTITDYFTSKVTSKLYAQGKFGSSIPNLGFFTMIGFDQVLHYGQLFLTFHFISNINWQFFT